MHFEQGKAMYVHLDIRLPVWPKDILVAVAILFLQTERPNYPDDFGLRVRPLNPVRLCPDHGSDKKAHPPSLAPPRDWC